MLLPNKVKHRKWQKGRRKKVGVSHRGATLNFGSFGLKAVGRAWIDSRQIESARRVITRTVQKGGKIWIRIFPDKPITKKGQETPMGGGKGSVDKYVVPIKPGRILFEMEGVPEEKAKEALLKASHKLPLKTKFVKRF